jgi:hypothetical protein
MKPAQSLWSQILTQYQSMAGKPPDKPLQKNKLALSCIVFLITQTVFAQLSLRETIIERIPPSQPVRSHGTVRDRLWEDWSQAPPVAPHYDRGSAFGTGCVAAREVKGWSVPIGGAS